MSILKDEKKCGKLGKSWVKVEKNISKIDGKNRIVQQNMRNKILWLKYKVQSGIELIFIVFLEES